MKLKHNQSLVDTLNMLVKIENKRALDKIAAGVNIDIVMQELSNRIMDKLYHLEIEEIKKNIQYSYNAENSKKLYEENYLNKSSPKSDHMNEDY